MKTSIPLIFRHKPESHIWQNSGLELWTEILLTNQTAGFFKM